MQRISDKEAIRRLRASDPKWAKFSEANLLRRYYEAKQRQRQGKLCCNELRNGSKPDSEK